MELDIVAYIYTPLRIYKGLFDKLYLHTKKNPLKMGLCYISKLVMNATVCLLNSKALVQDWKTKSLNYDNLVYMSHDTMSIYINVTPIYIKLLYDFLQMN